MTYAILNRPRTAAPGDPQGGMKAPDLRPTLIAATLTVLIGFGGFFLWAFLADLDAASMAPGVVIVESHRKTVQNLEGGILKELLVKEGDLVHAGQVLLRLDDTQASAQLTQLQNQYWATLARIARLTAESLDLPRPTFAGPLHDNRDRPDVKDAIQLQTRLFQTRKEQFEGQIEVQNRAIDQTNEEIAALNFTLDATREAVRTITEELKGVQELMARGQATKPRLLALQRDLASAKGHIGELKANIAKAGQAIAQTQLHILELRNSRRADAQREWQDAQTTASTLEEQIRSTSDVLKRREVTAPQDGGVTGLKYFTSGGVIPAGAPIMDIVPQDDELILEVKVQPNDIDVVHVGLKALIHLTAYKQRKVPAVEGEVVYVSADAVVDPNGTTYFIARVRLAPHVLDELPNVRLTPGMPANVSIILGKRRAIDYLMSPITDYLPEAMHEE